MLDWLLRRKAEPQPCTEGLPEMEGGPFFIRPMEAADADLLPKIFCAAIHGQAAAFYSPAQRRAWARAAADQAGFIASLNQGLTIVADLDGRAGAFAQLHPDNTLRMLYVAPALGGYGIATLLCQYLEDEARILGVEALHADASLAAQRFFEQMGFTVEAAYSTRRVGVAIPRLKMQKVLRKG